MKKLSDFSLRSVADSALFASLDDEVFDQLLNEATELSLRAGQVVVREGEPGEAMYVIKDGQVRVYTTRDDREVELNVLGPGACFGEVAMLNGRPRTATVVTLAPSQILCFHKRQVEKVLEDFPKVKKRLETLILGRARDTIEKMINVELLKP